jgi:hypothetical protein
VSNVVNFTGVTRLDLPADRIIESAAGKLDHAVVIGWDKAGSFYFASSYAAGPEVLWLLETARRKLLDAGA